MSRALLFFLSTKVRLVDNVQATTCIASQDCVSTETIANTSFSNYHLWQGSGGARCHQQKQTLDFFLCFISQFTAKTNLITGRCFQWLERDKRHYNVEYRKKLGIKAPTKQNKHNPNRPFSCFIMESLMKQHWIIHLADRHIFYLLSSVKRRAVFRYANTRQYAQWSLNTSTHMQTPTLLSAKEYTLILSWLNRNFKCSSHGMKNKSLPNCLI